MSPKQARRLVILQPSIQLSLTPVLLFEITDSRDHAPAIHNRCSIAVRSLLRPDERDGRDGLVIVLLRSGQDGPGRARGGLPVAEPMEEGGQLVGVVTGDRGPARCGVIDDVSGAVGGEYHPGDLHRPDRTRRDPDNTRKQLREVLAASEWKGLHPHAFRHLVATRLDAEGLSAREIADYLGHERISMTQDVYMARGATGAAAAAAMDMLGPTQ